MSLLYVTPRFSWRELECHDGTEIPDEVKPNLRRLCELVLEPIRAAWGGPIVVVSGYRSPAYNRAVGGAAKSRHVTGEAADIRPVSLAELPALCSLVQEMIGDGRLPGLGGWGRYRSWIHVDARQRPADGHIAYWTGLGVGSEPAI